MYKKFLIILLSFVFSGCVQNQVQQDDTNVYNEQDFSVGGPDAPFYNERTQEFMQHDNPYAEIDSYKPKNLIITVGILQEWKQDGKNIKEL